MIYETKRLFLEPFTKEDITDKYLSWFQNPTVTKYNSHGLGTYIRADAEKYLDENKDNMIFSVHVKFDSCLKKDQVANYNYMRRALSIEDFPLMHIGNISLQNISQLNRSAEFACIFGETDYWNKGFATEALKVLINHGFKKMNLNRIWTGTQSPNIGMRKIALNLNMKPEGKFREGIFLNGRYEDVHIYSILANEWREYETK